jgi:beta-lactam-binding protein with PASTA domain
VTLLVVSVVLSAVVLPAIALLQLHLDVQRERRARPPQTKLPRVKGLTYEDAEKKLHAAKLNIRLLATRYDSTFHPGLIIDQTPAPGEEVVCGYPVGVTLNKKDYVGPGP